MKNMTASPSAVTVNKSSASKTYSHGSVSTFPKSSRLNNTLANKGINPQDNRAKTALSIKNK